MLRVLQPQDAYGLEKLASEELCIHYDKDFGIECRIARFHNIYGPYGTWKGGREKAPAAFCRKVRGSMPLGPCHTSCLVSTRHGLLLCLKVPGGTWEYVFLECSRSRCMLPSCEAPCLVHVRFKTGFSCMLCNSVSSFACHVHAAYFMCRLTTGSSLVRGSSASRLAPS